MIKLHSGETFDYDVYINIYWDTEDKEFAVESNLSEAQLVLILQQTLVEVKQGAKQAGDANFN